MFSFLLKRRSDFPVHGRVTPVERVADFLGVNRWFLRRPPIQVDSAPDSLVSPAEGKIETLRVIGSDGWIDDKPVLGRPRRVHVRDLFGSEEESAGYVGGTAAKIYLAPWNLHFLLFPCSGRVISHRYRAGWAVPLLFVRQGDVLNERLCIHVETAHGFRMAVILVGSWMVNGIHHRFETGRDYCKGDDLGCFKVGSTVILATPTGAVDWTVKEGDSVQLGRPIGRLRSSAIPESSP